MLEDDTRGDKRVCAQFWDFFYKCESMEEAKATPSSLVSSPVQAFVSYGK